MALRRFWPEETVQALIAALLRNDARWIRIHMPALCRSCVRRIGWKVGGSESQQFWREWRRKLERAMRPVGLSLCVIGGTAEQRDELARALEETLRPAFRRSMIRDEATAGGWVGSALEVWLAKVRSTLVIRKGLATTRDVQVAVDRGTTFDQNLEGATRVALEYLAARLQRRMRLEQASLGSLRRAK